MKYVKGYFALSFIMFIFYSLTYIFFFNSSEDCVKNHSIKDSMLANIIFKTDGRDEIKNKEKYIDLILDAYKKEAGIDLSRPIFKILKDNSNVSNIKIEKIERNSYMSPNFRLSYTFNNTNYKINFIIDEPSFKKMKTAKALCITDSDDLLSMIGRILKIPANDIATLMNYSNSHLSNR